MERAYDRELSESARSSVIGFPNGIATVTFTQGCNLRCPWCYHKGVDGEVLPCRSTDFDGEACLRSLAQRKDRLRGVSLSGCEPLLQPRLPEFIAKIKDLGLLVKIDTNGTLPHRLKHLLDRKLLDYVALEIKAPIDDAGAYSFAGGGLIDISRLRDSVDLLCQAAPCGEFRTTLAPSFHKIGLLRRIVRSLPNDLPHCFEILNPKNAKSGYWKQLYPVSDDLLREMINQLRWEFPGHSLLIRSKSGSAYRSADAR
ncbi:radical SAM protein [Pelagicoccus sp. SDUM812003]|uniref:radical SAM protein n=1 Tax=Pelagicoccus sp. SDUM812003 TaxID=3041267 RepID=UPI00280E6BAA|nr:radical SAM protein [Pelagicoccus sp. SDUM812003]MDQ8202676.1 radical SAM protein [Pelagicoccus sp. SDUM812003]